MRSGPEALLLPDRGKRHKLRGSMDSMPGIVPAFVFVIFSLSLFCTIRTRAQNSGPTYHVTRRFSVGGGGGTDLIVDPDAHRLYVARADDLLVIDERSGKVLGEIPNTRGIKSIALAADLSKGYISNGETGTVTVFDLKTLKAIAQIETKGDEPNSIIYDPATKRVFTMNGRSSNSTVIDATTDKVVGTVILSGRPEEPVLDGRGALFVNLKDSNSIMKLDAKTLEVTGTWSLAPCDGPSSLTADTKNQRLFAACDKMIAVFDPETGKVVATAPIYGNPNGTGYDPASGLFFATERDGMLTVIHQDSPDKYTLIHDVSAPPGARTMTVNPKTHRIWTATGDSVLELEAESTQTVTPMFPWPPPTASATMIIPSSALIPPATQRSRLRDISSRLVGALDQRGYAEKSFYAVPGGFALVTQVEQINEDGTSKDEPARWSAKKQPLRTFSLAEYITALLTAPPGHYRLIVFIVTPIPFTQSGAAVSEEQAREFLSAGLNKLPQAIGDTLMTNNLACTALIYEFEERIAGKKPTIMNPSNLTGRDHVTKSGLLVALGMVTHP
jgi:YVTN family beta-propeller protein